MVIGNDYHASLEPSTLVVSTMYNGGPRKHADSIACVASHPALLDRLRSEFVLTHQDFVVRFVVLRC